ncbi:MAG: IS6 family transposase [Moraxellaceae bacterium]|nr:MAG: IS6 family transposase [Moraxellaceae bacterium]
MNNYKRFRYPSQIISHAIWLYHRFTLSFRDIEEILACRGIVVSYESIRQWCLKFTPAFAKSLKKKQGSLGDEWYLDEVFIKINGKLRYLWRAVDQDGSELDVIVTKRRDKKAAIKFFKKLFKSQHMIPRKIVTDKLASYKAALDEIGSNTPHITDQYKNNIAEISHQKTRQQQRQMRQFKSIAQTQRFLASHGVINNHFRQQRHLLKAKHYREIRDRAFEQWTQVTCVQNLDTRK